MVPPYLRIYDNYKFLNPLNGKKLAALDSKSITKSISYMASFFDGMPINERYTNFAHHFLVKEMLGERKLVYICDRDESLNNSIIRNNKSEILNNKTYVFNFKINKDLNKYEANHYSRQKEVRFNLLLEKVNQNKHTEPISLLEKLMEKPYKKANENHYIVHDEKYFGKNDKKLSLRKKTFFEYPLPLKEEGERNISMETHSNLPIDQITCLFPKISLSGIENYHSIIRQQLRFLSRTDPGSKGGEKGYQKAARSPEVLHKLITIFRVCHNFHELYGSKTPAMKIGLVDKVYSLEDILNLE